MILRLSTFTAAALLAGAAAMPAQETYQIDLDRPIKDGQPYQVEVQFKGTQSMKMSGEDGTVVQEQSENMEGMIKGTATEQNDVAPGEEMTITLEVEEFSGTANGQALTTGLKAGDVIKATGTEETGTTITINDEPVSDPALDGILQQLVPLSSDQVTMADDAFSPDAPQAVGAEWQVDGKALADQILEEMEGGSLSPDDVKGTVTLAEVKEVDGVQMQVVTGTYDIGNMEMPMPMPVEYKKKDIGGSVKAQMPVDLSNPNGTQTLDLKMDIVMEAEHPEQGKMTIDVGIGFDQTITVKGAEISPLATQ